MWHVSSRSGVATLRTALHLLLVRVADLPGRRSLRSARTNRLLVPPVKLSTVGGRAFPVAGPTIWNSLPDSVISAPSVNLPSAFKNISVPGLIP